MSVTPRGMSIQEAYREFRDGHFRVNRRYQRKLVWSLSEKQHLIDSVLEGYPIPLLLLAYHLKADGSKSFEILDGMQRLNAVFGFIENAFPVNERYFDVTQLSRAKTLADEGKIARPPDGAVLYSADECARLLEYTLAVTEFPAVNEEAVTEVFGRINSFGRQLSDQERRQAGIVSAFATVVREVAAEIRGDVSSESLDLAQMPEISVDVSGEMQGYAIRADETFWCKQGVLRRSQLRESEDEQMIADLAISVLSQKPFAFSGGALDEIYKPQSEEGRELNLRVGTYGSTRLKHELVSTLSVLRGVIEAVDGSPNAFRNAVHPGSGNPAKTEFYAVFMAFFDLCVRQRKSPKEDHDLLGALSGVEGKLEIAAGRIRSESRQTNINTVKGLIQDHFEDKEPPALNHGSGATMQFENGLRRSRIESAAFECKQGILRLDDKRTKDPELLARIVETICAIANLGPQSTGAVFIGVADKLADKRRVEELDAIQSVNVGARYCVGVDREARVLKIAVEEYVRNIVSYISKSGLSEPLKTAVCAAVDPIVYRGVTNLCIWIPSQKTVASVDDKLFIRVGSETRKVEGLKQTQAVMALFE
ncbi:MAG: DUF262 domain-containing protein [Kofleriaceae bacterium]|nr:DUF262 domain-containing protein [Kofleriaceae bacterium]